MLERFVTLSEEERSARFSLAERLAMIAPERRHAFLTSLPPRLKGEFLRSWQMRGRPAQLEPEGRWRTWLIMAGRGFGKTRAGAEWAIGKAGTPGRRIALVGPTEDEVRNVMIEGASGILASARDDERPLWEPSLGRLTWPNGSQAFVHSGANPEALRGPEHDFAWCDELAKWARGEATWDNLMFGLRRGELPQALVTTTPRPTPLMRRLVALADVRTRGRTADNVQLAESFTSVITDLYGGTRLGRQELDGELIEDVEGSLWPRDLIEKCRTTCPSPCRGEGGARSRSEWEGEGLSSSALPEHRSPAASFPSPLQGEGFRRIVVGVDPPASAQGDACGIVVCGLSGDVGFVLEDSTVSGLRPEGWARAVAAAAERWSADRVVAEGNQGGEMVESVLRGADINLPISIVYARFGKSARAEPVAALFERGAGKFAGAFPELEDELAGMTAGGGYEGPGRSPDRADAMVWAMTELMLGKRRAMPRITQL
jgi:phage terminase large subunit-like protein